MITIMDMVTYPGTVIIMFATVFVGIITHIFAMARMATPLDYGSITIFTSDMAIFCLTIHTGATQIITTMIRIIPRTHIQRGITNQQHKQLMNPYCQILMMPGHC